MGSSEIYGEPVPAFRFDPGYEQMAGGAFRRRLEQPVLGKPRPASLGFPIRKRFNPVSMGKISENAGDLPAYAARNTLYLPRAGAWNDES